jgi:cation diffusion facilitator CzcD-associated flavoprotein CzcO
VSDATHFDVVIIGAGLSGIGTACHLQRRCPARSFVLLEGRGDIGGTWDLFRYPGVRSDSDMHTLGYSFKPWVADQAIADAASIMTYLRETVAEHRLMPHIRFGHRVTRATWNTATSNWTLEVATEAGADVAVTCNFLSVCAGYYSYKAGHTPAFRGRESFTGLVVHPQQWPEQLDYAGKRVVVVGSGATAMTLVPALARTAAHVTMVQRSPTYVVARPAKDALANRLRSVLPARTAYNITRWKNTRMQQFFYRQTRTKPAKSKERLLGLTRQALGEQMVADHFTPSYNPWDERLCLVPDGDLYAALNNGTASVVTGDIDCFTDKGVRMSSGEVIEADIIVTATGLEMVTLGEIDVEVDGRRIDFADTFTYKGFGYSDVPNLASTFGYINASWTLRADLIAEYTCRLLNHMAATRTSRCVPRLRPSDATMSPQPWITGFNPGYISRSMHRMPKQGDRAPWLNPQNYGKDRQMFLKDPVDDGVMQFT